MLSLRRVKKHLVKRYLDDGLLQKLLTNEGDPWLGQRQIKRKMYSVVQVATFTKDLSHFYPVLTQLLREVTVTTAPEKAVIYMTSLS